MLQRTAYFKCTVRFLRLCVNIALGFILVLLSLSAKNPALPKSLAYGFVRETAKKEVEFRTRNWNSLKNEQFLIKYQNQDLENVNLVLDTINMDFQKVNEMLNFTNNGRVPIIIYPDSPSLGKSFGWDSDQSAMGVYWAGVIRIVSPEEWLGDLSQESAREVFRKKGPMVHEYAHLVVDYRTRGNYTRWFTEGIAQLIEKEITGFQFENTALNTDTAHWYDLKDMDRDFDTLPSQALAYSQSLVMIQWLVDEYGYDDLNTILNHLGAGKTLNQAFQIVIGKTLNQFMEACKNSY
ncbi:peptidase MA family metallohydrolase [Desulfitibacter alkalitolerans]|uniref:peptidase MA family metallohydrolase n=1 Tax=Desulfitibacter alkalitolerans TaxID=264641 RepID=UPI0006853A93|nr:hypothetical protein [Desulfitibacter alkalitolerans]